ncbi:MAG: YggT family protein [Cyanobacteria bacterium REEB67]|nr:YggT family protein [Cyanobacteria bacterium REEB67]
MNAVAHILSGVLQLFSMALFIWCLLSWFPNINRREPPVSYLDNIIRPIMAPIQKVIPPIGNIDISPIVVMLLVGFLNKMLSSLF